ncbi:MAG: hypothetical protein SFX73_16280 [Kofleriaceae bacterium]|nr:hypothetical protein [Kofleriaceae bacterium]
MAKRSPILGYNHNVRYRGLIFHVQTEDSGLMSPHLFTHLFHGGVILSTRKLVYDAGAAEDSIKGLMQAQHKVVLKDLKGGKFDDKIDQYLGDTPGLLPRENGGGPAQPDDSASRASAPEITIEHPGSDLPQMDTGPEVPLSVHQMPTAPVPSTTSPSSAPSMSRTKTAERGSAPTTVRSPLATPPPSEMLDAATLADSDAAAIAAAVAAANATVKTQMPSGELQLLDADEDDGEVISLTKPVSDGVPGAIGASPSGAVRTATDVEKRSAVGAASLPPPRPIARPPSRQNIAPPVPPPRTPTEDADGDRPGQYSQHRKASDRIPVDVVRNDRSGSTPIPNVPRTGSSGTGSRPIAQPPPVPTHAPSAGSRPEQRPRTPTPARVSGPSSSTPAQGRSPSTQSGGVVMTRPAVIVGAPAKAPTTSRVRKAREDEGRGFGQGLISEKSLDEVILAYLSEDSDDK